MVSLCRGQQPLLLCFGFFCAYWCDEHCKSYEQCANHTAVGKVRGISRPGSGRVGMTGDRGLDPGKQQWIGEKGAQADASWVLGMTLRGV